MPQNFEKSVKGATKIKLAAPKSKYIEHILLATHSGEAGIAEIFRTLQNRLRDSTWTIVFKSLIVLHLMIREGAPDATLEFLADNPRKIAISSFSEVQAQGRNIRRYSDYFIARARGFADTKVDYVRNGQGRLKRLTVDKGMLRETEAVQRQIKALLRCDLLTDEVENEITLTSFRLLTLDLLVLYSVMNEGTINVLEHYFEMSRPDSERALKIYKTFSTQTEEVVKFLGVARHFEAATRLEIPNLKHASTDLAQLLEDDLNDPDFDLRRREYRVQKESNKSGRAAPSALSKSADSTRPGATSTPSASKSARAAAPKIESKPPAPDLIDFFESIEQHQQPMAQQAPPQQQAHSFQQAGYGQAVFQTQLTGFPQQAGYAQPPQPGFVQQQTGFGSPYGVQGGNPFPPTQQPQQLQSTPTGAGFGGYTSQPQSYGFQSSLAPISQDGVASFPPQQGLTNGTQQQQQQQQQQATNPFRQSMLVGTPTGSPGSFNQPGQTASPLTRQNTNPFAKRLSTALPQFNGHPSAQAAAFPPQSTPQSAPQPLQAQRTGTNPFARNSPVSAPQAQPTGLQPLQPHVTGSTNPFRQSAFVNQQTGQGWHVSGQQGSMGGLEQLETVPVFPRPGLT